MALGLIPKHWMQSLAFPSNEITLQKDGTKLLLLCLVTMTERNQTVQTHSIFYEKRNRQRSDLRLIEYILCALLQT